MEKDLVILFSGGADSRLMLEMANDLGRKVHCVLVDYGQKHAQELGFAIDQLDKFEGVTWQVVKLDGLDIDSGLTGNKVPDTYEGVHSMHVPSRNLMFIGIAASIAENMGVDTIWYGPDWSDYLNIFPDCKQEWVGRTNKVLEINGPKPIKLEAPLMGLSKENILSMLERKYNVTKDKLFSGYGDN